MSASFKPVFNRARRKNKSNLYTISIRATIDRQTGYLNPGLPKISPKDWSGKPNKWIKDSHSQHYLFNKKIQDKLSELNEFGYTQQLLDNPLSLKKVEEFFYRRGDKSSFNDYVEEYIRTRKFKAVGTMKKYKTFQTLLNEFNPKIRFNNLEENLFLGFIEFLSDKGQNGNTIDKYFDPFKMIVKDAYRRDYIHKNPFEAIQLNIKKEKPTRTTLSKVEIEKIEELTFNEEDKKLEQHRDMFLLLCYSGLYYNDVRLINSDSLQRKSGKLFLVGDRYKTGHRYISPVFHFENFEKILDKYEFPKKDLPLISDQKFNEALKRIGKKAELNKTISNKVGRNAFSDMIATMNYSEMMLKKFLGHTKDSNSFKHYMEIEIEHILDKPNI